MRSRVEREVEKMLLPCPFGLQIRVKMHGGRLGWAGLREGSRVQRSAALFSFEVPPSAFAAALASCRVTAMLRVPWASLFVGTVAKKSGPYSYFPYSSFPICFSVCQLL